MSHPMHCQAAVHIASQACSSLAVLLMRRCLRDLERWCQCRRPHMQLSLPDRSLVSGCPAASMRRVARKPVQGTTHPARAILRTVGGRARGCACKITSRGKLIIHPSSLSIMHHCQYLSSNTLGSSEERCAGGIERIMKQQSKRDANKATQQPSTHTALRACT